MTERGPPDAPEKRSGAREPAKPLSGDRIREPGGGAGFSMTDAMRTAVADSTAAAYERGWRRFAAYCDDIKIDPLAATPEDGGTSW